MSKPILRALLSLVIVAGLLVAVWPLGQTVYANWNQNRLQDEWQAGQKQASVGKEQDAGKKQPQSQDKQPQPQARKSQAKWPTTRLVIPDADVDVIVLEGWDESTLRRAPGHLPGSALPGEPGNIAIAGHRNVYGSPFYKVDSLMAGAPIELHAQGRMYVYRVISVGAVTDTDTSVLRPSKEPGTPPELTLVSCTIPRTTNRIIVYAQLEVAS